MSLGFLNYNPQTGVQYPVYPYDSGMAYPPYGLPWPIEQTRGNALLPYALSEGMCASNGQWPWFLRTPRVVTGPQNSNGNGNGEFSAWGSSLKTGLTVAGISFVAYLLIYRMVVAKKKAGGGAPIEDDVIEVDDVDFDDEDDDDFDDDETGIIKLAVIPSKSKSKRRKKAAAKTAGARWFGLGDVWSRSKPVFTHALIVAAIAGVSAAVMQSTALSCAVAKGGLTQREREVLKRLQTATARVQQAAGNQGAQRQRPQRPSPQQQAVGPQVSNT